MQVVSESNKSIQCSCAGKPPESQGQIRKGTVEIKASAIRNISQAEGIELVSSLVIASVWVGKGVMEEVYVVDYLRARAEETIFAKMMLILGPWGQILRVLQRSRVNKIYVCLCIYIYGERFITKK